jgi:hypothetical protein
VSERLRGATQQRYGETEVAFVTRFLVNVFSSPAEFCEIKGGVERYDG